MSPDREPARRWSLSALGEDSRDSHVRLRDHLDTIQDGVSALGELLQLVIEDYWRQLDDQILGAVRDGWSMGVESCAAMLVRLIRALGEADVNKVPMPLIPDVFRAVKHVAGVPGQPVPAEVLQAAREYVQPRPGAGKAELASYAATGRARLAAAAAIRAHAADIRELAED